jgi:hypothetical protein
VIAGTYTGAHGVFHGFTDRRGVFTPVNDPAGAKGTAPEGISNTGVIAGFYTDSHGTNHGFTFTPAR